MTFSLFVYQALTSAIAPVLPLLLQSRAKKGKEDPDRLQERLGYASRKRPEGPFIWLHGASIGESQVLLLLFEALRKVRPDLKAVITTQTLTSADLIARKPQDGLIHQMAPLDTPFAAERFLKHWRPDIAVFAEGDIWPNLLTKLDQRRIPRLLINARMTDTSFKGWARFPALARKLFGGFTQIVAANQRTADFLKAYHRKRIRMAGNIKYSAPPMPADETELRQLQAIIGRRPVLAAISTHPGEETLVHRALSNIENQLSQKPLLILAPRHPDRGTDLAQSQIFAEKTYLRSRDETPSPDHDVWICDTLGEVGLWCRLADVVFLGGGLPDSGIFGHNPIEPLKLQRHVISFSEVDNFKVEFADMEKAGAADLVGHWRDLSVSLLPYLKRERGFSADTMLLSRYLQADFALDASRDAVLNALSPEKPR